MSTRGRRTCYRVVSICVDTSYGGRLTPRLPAQVPLSKQVSGGTCCHDAPLARIDLKEGLPPGFGSARPPSAKNPDALS